MQLTRPRFWLLGVLAALYLAGVLFLSALTLHEPAFRLTTGGVGITGTPGAARHHEGPKIGRGLEQKILMYNRLPFDQTVNKRVGGGAFRRNRIQWCSELKYMQPPAEESVALASFPGSGNTWLRYLLQQATGVLTGSVYKDYGLMKNGFPAESVSNGSVLVVKTHEWGPIARRPFKKAVLLVRAPSAAIQAEFNRQSGGHVGFASPDRYRRTKGKYWQQFVTNKLAAWKKTNMDWLKNFSGPTHVIFYEQLVEDPEHTLRTILDFLEFPIDKKQFECAISRQEGIYRRKKRVLNFDPYNNEMKRKMKLEQEVVYDAIYKIASPSR